MADNQRTIIELELTLKAVQADLKDVPEVKAMVLDHERTCNELREQVQELHDVLYVTQNGDGPLVQQIAFLRKQGEYVSNWIRDAKAAKDRSGKERIAIYTALIAALGGIISQYLRTH